METANAAKAAEESDYTDLDDELSIPDGESELASSGQEELEEAMREGVKRFGPNAAALQETNKGQNVSQTEQDAGIADVTGHIAEPSADNATQQDQDDAESTAHNNEHSSSDISSESSASGTSTSIGSAHSPLQVENFSISVAQQQNDLSLFVDKLQQIQHRQTELIHALVYSSINTSDRDVKQAMRVMHLFSQEVIDAVQQSCPRDSMPVTTDTARKLYKILPASAVESPADTSQDDLGDRADLTTEPNNQKNIKITDGDASSTANIVTKQDEQHASASEWGMLDVSLEVGSDDEEKVAKGRAAGLFDKPKTTEPSIPRPAETSTTAAEPFGISKATEPSTSQQANEQQAQEQLRQIRMTLERSLNSEDTRTAFKRPRKGDNFPPDDALVIHITGARAPYHALYGRSSLAKAASDTRFRQSLLYIPAASPTTTTIYRDGDSSFSTHIHLLLSTRRHVATPHSARPVVK